MTAKPTGPGRGPAATGKGTERRVLLLDVAERILTESGHGALTMRAVATAAEVRLGHLQHYFPTRADLVAAVLRRCLDASLERLAPLLTGSGPGGRTAPDVLVRRLLAEQDDPLVVRLYAEVWALAARDEAVATVVRDFYDGYRSHVADYVGSRQPGLPEDVRRVRADVFVMLVEGAALFRSGIAGHRRESTDTELVTRAVALLEGPPG
ncbi:TetR family transcriptional regulator [Streptomyces cinnamoneus]|uniref:TetR family transcriptional regulator n=1 Tax=Streptomyces cinnamoneus TaxID=53446 RepID=A0A2G1XJL8_STRCJ|nr:TetR/AcrR family transcriptional regulator [Streptomyces cinnamoneus]PHQ51400.1 TetR family transcriptional regulator [Streptomyces cinnamoneus]PPT11740.1 TetR/AcrR family transcriptional regulator [Streptomyces cinnamoneus]